MKFFDSPSVTVSTDRAKPWRGLEAEVLDVADKSRNLKIDNNSLAGIKAQIRSLVAYAIALGEVEEDTPFWVVHTGDGIVRVIDEPVFRSLLRNTLPRSCVLDLPDMRAVLDVAKFLEWEVV